MFGVFERGWVMSAITQYGARGGGARALGLTVDGIAVLVTPSTADENVKAARLAEQICDAGLVDAVRVETINGLKADLDAAKARASQAAARIAALEAINAAAIAGRRRFFGPVLMKPAIDGNWAGEVWLLDPEKKERGVGLRFASVAEVRALHPELWVIGATADGVMLDAWGGK